MEISSGPSIQMQVDALKKSTEVQEQAMTKLLESNTKDLQQQQEQMQKTQSSASALTGFGTSLDVSV